ncbi:hypothetical protein B0H66DRAFT_273893 [Apodospora peruviana]|uniref:Uncharacterized protein n=1 Tax=Apodospora peruviana TaxID=516989 RepID=A0AAE0HZT6_9PEZI|nr:hypothetical protein B0H66DRAFT_273893 [Apodospora peruviana]
MDNDQFGGRTDDDLFSDDFEPVVPEEEIVSVPEPIAPKLQDAPAPVPAAAPPSAPAGVTASTASTTSEPPRQPQAQAQAPPKSLAQSRHNHNRPEKPPRGPSFNKGPKHTNKPDTNSSHNDNTVITATAAPNTSSPSPQPTPSTTTATPDAAPSPPSAPLLKDNVAGRNTASVNSESRIGSGVNPRKKPTETELAAKMEAMRILAVEKTRKFEQAQRDESEHAVAYKKGMEEARKRRAEEALRKRAADEDRQRLETERAKNRERKLAAMGMKEGGWDEGKEERLQDEEKKGFRGANGGVRGTVNKGLAGSRYASAREFGDQQPPQDEQRYNNGDRDNNRGFRGGFGRGGGQRGRGRRGGGRDGGGRLFDADDHHQHREFDGTGEQQQGGNWTKDKPQPKANPASAEDFPALPGSTALTAEALRKLNTKQAQAASSTYAKPNASFLADEIPLSPPVGRWDEEVGAAMDAKAAAENNNSS